MASFLDQLRAQLAGLGVPESLANDPATAGVLMGAAQPYVGLRDRPERTSYVGGLKQGLAQGGLVGGLYSAAGLNPSSEWFPGVMRATQDVGRAVQGGLAGDPTFTTRAAQADQALGYEGGNLGLRAAEYDLQAQAAQRDLDMQAELAGIDPTTAEGRNAAARTLMRYGYADKAVALLKEPASEPLSRVNRGGRPVLVPRSEAVGQEAFVSPPASVSVNLGDTGSPKELRAEFRDASKQFREVLGGYQRVQSAGDTAGGDLALIFGFMKLLDPGSTVREGEFANAQNAAGVPDQIRNLFNRVQTGERLTPAQRLDFKGQAQSVYQTYVGQQRQLEAEYRRLAEASGVDPSAVIIDYGGQAKPRAVSARPLE